MNHHSPTRRSAPVVAPRVVMQPLESRTLMSATLLVTTDPPPPQPATPILMLKSCDGTH